MNKKVDWVISKKIVKLYNKGLSQRKVGKVLGISQDTVKKWLRKIGVSARSLSESHKGLQMGEGNPSWKGGITPLYKQIRTCQKYDSWRLSIFERDNFICQMPSCGHSEKFLVAHHIVKFQKIVRNNNIKTLEGALHCEELWNADNGITLCKKCHKKNDKKRRTI